MIDRTAMRVHAHGANPAGGQAAQAMARSRPSLSTKIHLACDALGYPLSFILSGANVSGFDQAKPAGPPAGSHRLRYLGQGI